MTEHSVFLPAYAKINLHLRVLGKRKDGYHEIESVFQRISIADSLLVRLVPSGFSVHCPNFELPVENTLRRAFELFKATTGFSGGVNVSLVKGIPVGAGLGGGSSDAVELLKALNILTGAGLSLSEMQPLALQIGSDCPFFLQEPVAVVSGRGEVFSPIDARLDCLGVLIFPDVHSSSAEAYSLLDKRNRCHGNCFKKSPDGFLAEQYKLDFSKWCFVNDFEEVLFEKHSEVLQAKSALLSAGADFALMSGSGSSVFGLFPLSKSELVKKACEELGQIWKFCKPFVFTV